MGCGWINTHARLGETPVASGYMTATDAHPADGGHAEIARGVLEVI